MTEAPGRRPLSEINRLIREKRVHDYRSPNLALGMAPVEFGSGTSRWEWRDPPPQVLNPFGTIQGGYLALLVDEVFATAIASVLAEDEFAVTGEFKVSFLRALRPEPLCASGRVLKRSRTLAFLEAQISARDGDPAVTASSTWAVLKV